jgi:hypothetical protein
MAAVADHPSVAASEPTNEVHADHKHQEHQGTHETRHVDPAPEPVPEHQPEPVAQQPSEPAAETQQPHQDARWP